MSTLIIGNVCTDGVVIAADRRELRGYELGQQQCKIRRIELEDAITKASVLLGGAGVSAFWDEVAWSLSIGIRSGTMPPVKTLMDVVDRISSVSLGMYARYQQGGMDEKLGCIVAGLENLTSGKSKLYYFAGAGFSETRFICLGSGDAYALPMADLLLNRPFVTLEQAVKALPVIFALVERVNVSVAGGPDIFVLKDGEQATQTPVAEVEDNRARAKEFLQKLPEAFVKMKDDRATTKNIKSKIGSDQPEEGSSVTQKPIATLKEENVTPKILADRLGISPKKMRDFLRKDYPRDFSQKGKRWIISAELAKKIEADY